MLITYITPPPPHRELIVRAPSVVVEKAAIIASNGLGPANMNRTNSVIRLIFLCFSLDSFLKFFCLFACFQNIIAGGSNIGLGFNASIAQRPISLSPVAGQQGSGAGSARGGGTLHFILQQSLTLSGKIEANGASGSVT